MFGYIGLMQAGQFADCGHVPLALANGRQNPQTAGVAQQSKPIRPALERRFIRNREGGLIKRGRHQSSDLSKIVTNIVVGRASEIVEKSEGARVRVATSIPLNASLALLISLTNGQHDWMSSWGASNSGNGFGGRRFA